MLGTSVRKILEQELNKRFYITQLHLTVDDLFRCKGITSWIKALFSSQRMETLDRRIDEAPPYRLLHAISTYLLGIALREGVGIDYRSLPRIFSVSSAGGDAFSFFWSGICLCHDLGFGYEEITEPFQQVKMLSKEGRKELLDLKYDLLSLKREDYPTELMEIEADWVEETLLLANRYSRYRIEGMDGAYRRIDHGIAGASILYDALRRESVNGFLCHPTAGEFEVNARHSRFEACCLLMACAIARHNMWVANTSNILDYQVFNLYALCPGPELKKVTPEKPEEQMLFLLDFMDTIDPVKNLYVRLVENDPDSFEELEKRLYFLLNSVCISFDGERELDYRWEEFLPYRQVVLSATPSNPDEEIWLADYLNRLKGMSSWLDTREPDVNNVQAVCYYPRQRKVERTWPGGITDKQIDAICLYVGSGVPGKSGRFYQLPNAYQTFNLLMMEGLEGEQIRVCTERQTPDSIYIRDWKRTIEVFTDIFRAQCRCCDFVVQENMVLPKTLYRADRKLNVERMRNLGHTFAFTSVSKNGYLSSFAVDKQDPALLEITLDDNCPYLDLVTVLQDNYVYVDEAELLFPPFISAKVSGGEYLTKEQMMERGLELGSSVLAYQVRFGGFCNGITDKEDPYELIQHLEQNKEVAAQVLESICRCQCLECLSNETLRSYIEWKHTFAQLIHLCFDWIWMDVSKKHAERVMNHG